MDCSSNRMHYFTEYDFPSKQIDFRLRNPNSFAELKIGISTGKFLCKIASFYKDRFFVGIEYKPKSSLAAARRIVEKELTNAVVVNMEALQFISRWIPDQSFYVIHIYFPTPTPSRIGLRSRLITQNFVDEAHRILCPWGILRFVTDHSEYYEDACRHFSAKKWWAVDWQNLDVGQATGQLVGTPHEIQYRKENRNIYSLQLFRLG